MKQKDRKPAFALEDWIVEPEFNQLSQGTNSHRVEPKVMSVLLELAAHAQRVVSKDEILRAVWPDTFVGEDALTRCISVLRRILEDDPHNPRFIKTISKVGYCLLVVAHPLESPPADIPSPQSPPLPDSKKVTSPTPAVVEIPHNTPPPELTIGKRKPGVFATAALILAVVSALGVWMVHAIRANSIPVPIRVSQLTTNAGEQSRPALSSDGKRLAFVWAKDDGGQQHIYIKELGKESLLRLTDLSDDEYSPAWSPDGKQVAFLSSSRSGLGLYVASLAATLSVRKVYIPGETTRWEQGALSWSPDGKSFVLVDHVGSEPSSSIYLIDVETLRAHSLTAPPPGWEGDLSPVFSPNGQKIAFLRASESSVEDIYWIPTPGGEPRQITHDGKMINGIAWSSDNRSIIFSSNRAGQYALWKVSLDGGTPHRMPVGTEDATQPAIPQDGNNLAFVQGSAIFGILRVSATKNESPEVRESPIVSSTAQDSAPSISPDGAQFAFQSWRSGSQQIWVSSIDGQTLRQLTPVDGVLQGSGSPSWSPDGDRILFDSRVSGHSHIFVIGSTGGNPKQITFGEVNDIVPRWSVDGRSIYFRSNRGGRWQLWKLPASGGMPQPVTSDDGIVGQESPDGQWLYFARGGENGIWRMPMTGGDAVRILDQPMAGYWAYWTVGRSGIYFLDQKQSTPSISIYDPVTEKTTCFAKLNRLPPLYSGLSLLHDGRDLLISDKSDAGSHISLAQGVF
ncbi:DPP IV N-terminal domain-containing protein [Tunturiibacter lichenicola]|uniref:DPP IV N-terminal domain-containing protein n=1 Tax=Tunturiibacter lichenicola TaxID=2051959 RepID=UPI0021B39E62|nr:winged helix-turn-helix domain-containing protein [Edaphobacter lichenicola]